MSVSSIQGGGNPRSMSGGSPPVTASSANSSELPVSSSDSGGSDSYGSDSSSVDSSFSLGW